jgi:hypothetical protein
MKKDTISANRIVGELIQKEKYKFIDGKLIAEIVKDTIDTINDWELYKTEG